MARKSGRRRNAAIITGFSEYLFTQKSAGAGLSLIRCFFLGGATAVR